MDQAIALSEVSREILNYANTNLNRNRFFRDLREGLIELNVVRDVFRQYYLWRNQFHRWFGVCIARSPAFGTKFDIDFVLSELIEHIEQEIKGDHHGMCVKFMNGLGVAEPRSSAPLAETIAYNDSFIARYMNPEKTGAEALAALAGREIVAPGRNRLIVTALQNHYGVKEGLEFFNLHEELEIQHFEALWRALVDGYEADERALASAARHEIDRHLEFWAEVYGAIATGSERAIA